MCHLLYKYDYPTMLNASVVEAMGVFKGRVNEIPDGTQVITNAELSKATKDILAGLLDLMVELFSESTSYQNMRMRDLYTLEQGNVSPAIINLFGMLDSVIGSDTDSQVLNGQKRFTNPCKLCLPFLPRLLNSTIPEWKPVPPDKMESFVAGIGNNTLMDLFLKPPSELGSTALGAMKLGRECRILSSPTATYGVEVIEFDNKLLCDSQTLTCKDATSGFCVHDSTGQCSAMKKTADELRK